jgi:secreted Zn-dependent insulinase-like peptidase
VEDVISFDGALIWLAEHMLFMGSSKFPDENEVLVFVPSL